MKGHIAEDILIAYVLAEVAGTERDEIASHLSGCDACREVASRLAAAVQSYAEASVPEAPPEVLLDLMDAQAGSRKLARSPRPALRPLWAPVAMAALAAIFLFGFWAGRVTREEGPDLSEASGDRAALPHPLPDPPEFGFQTEPPLEIHLATSRPGWHPAGGARDSL
jgi:anti-sigma factor RsiW